MNWGYSSPMGQPGRALAWLAVAALCFARGGSWPIPPPAKAQFFNWFNSEPAPKPRGEGEASGRRSSADRAQGEHGAASAGRPAL